MNTKEQFQALDPKKYIIIKGAEVHNLKAVDVAIPRNKLVVITGLSGSGKSSLAFDTLYAEGQRRYVESLSSYARQFLGRLDKPKVEYIKGIAPAIAIEQKVNTTNARSTVGTSTEIYDYLKLMYARIGQTFSPVSGQEVKKDTVSDVVDVIKTLETDSPWMLLAPITLPANRDWPTHLNTLIQQSYTRVWYQGKMQRLDQMEDLNLTDPVELIIDRLIVQSDEGFLNRVADAVATAFYEGKGSCSLQNIDTPTRYNFDTRFSLDGVDFLEPNVHLFSFNNPYGACSVCEGYGNIIGVDPELVIPNSGLSIYENAIFPWRGESMSFYRNELVKNAHKFDFPIHTPYYLLSPEEKELVWTGNAHFEGLNDFFSELEAKNYKIQNRVMLSRYRGKTICPACKGTRLRPEASYVKVNGQSLPELVLWPIRELRSFFDKMQLTAYQEKVAHRLLIEIQTRLRFLQDVGLEYLTLNRNSSTLSGGESQRINLATSLGSSLVGSMYILDEPSIGLHSKDSLQLIGVLQRLRDLGNTVIVVEHDEEIMQQADYIIDIGPEAGYLGGEVVATGTYTDFLKKDSLTAQYLSGERRIEVPATRRKWLDYIEVKGARENNLKNVDVIFPLDTLTVVTGVSGSGKSTLVKKILYPALTKAITGMGDKPGQFTSIDGSFSKIKNVEFVDQNPIGRSSRSNPVTYLKVYDDIRDLFSKEKLSKLRGYLPKHFSFNTDGGRCETCRGEGTTTVGMVFMADVELPCETCGGKRFKKEILEVNVYGKNIHDILSMTVDEAVAFFQANKIPKIAQKLQPLMDVGLSYVQLGQSSSTLSGGEAQRIKLASFLVKGAAKEKVLFIFDEPTTGLHFHDINKLLASFDALIENGHSVIVIEHNLDLIKCADHVIDLGPTGGEGGGYILATGTPEQVAENQKSVTGSYLKEKLA